MAQQLTELQEKWLQALESGRYVGLLPAMLPKDLVRWLSRVSVADDGCWIWQGAANGDGYGYTNLRSQVYRCNRLFYILGHEAEPGNLLVCHSCDVRLCVNPAHLFLGDLAANNQDRAAKGRSRNQAGENNNMCKLSTADVLAIKEMLSGGVSRRILAITYNVCRQTIDNIATGKRRASEVAPAERGIAA